MWARAIFEIDAEYYVLQEDYDELEEENKKLKENIVWYEKEETRLNKENKKLKETIKDHQLYEEKLEHRIIEFEELLHWE